MNQEIDIKAEVWAKVQQTVELLANEQMNSCDS